MRLNDSLFFVSFLLFMLFATRTLFSPPSPLFSLFFFWDVGYHFWIVHLGRVLSGKVQVGLLAATVREIKGWNSMEARCLVLFEIWASYPSRKSQYGGESESSISGQHILKGEEVIFLKGGASKTGSSYPLYPTCPWLPFAPISYPFSHKLIPIYSHADLTVIPMPTSHLRALQTPPYPFLVFHATHTYHSSLISYITIHHPPLLTSRPPIPYHHT